MQASVVGVVGVGQMGGEFARHLAAAGHHTIAVDPDAERRDLVRRAGCALAGDVAELAHAHPRVIVVSLATDIAFDEVIDQLAAAADPRSPPIVVDTSTLALITKEDARARLAGAGVVLLDCPVSGTSVQARLRDVVVYASGPADAVTACTDVLACFARDVHVVGDFGAGSRLKYLANLLVGIHTVAAAEMIALAQRAGIDARDALAGVSAGAGQSRMLDVRGPQMASGDYGSGARIDLFRKDLAIIKGFASELGASTPLLDVVTDCYERAAAAGRGRDELAAVHAVYLGRGT